MQRETRFKINVIARLRRLMPHVWFTKLQQVSKRGEPDLLLCVCGKFVAWELKVQNNKTTKLQQYTLDKIELANGMARVVTPENIDECMQELHTIIKEKTNGFIS